MDHIRVLKTLTLLINFLIQSCFSPSKGNCVFLNELFTETSNPGHVPYELYNTRHVHSCGECASICLMERASPWVCGAYSCLPSEMSCDFYAVWTQNAIPLSINLYLFQATNVFHPMSINGHSYSIYLSSVRKTYQDARTHCENMDSRLFHFDSLEDYEAIRMINDGKDAARAFVGATDQANEGTWLSVRDGTVIDTSVWIWSTSEPSNNFDNEHCAFLHIQLHDIICTRTEKFICKKYL